MRKEKVFITDPLLSSIPKMAQKRFPKENDQIEWMIANSGEKEELLKVIPCVNIIVVGRQQITRELIQRADKAYFIQQCGMGYDNIDIAAARSRNIVVATAGPAGVISVAEHTILLMLAVAKSLPLAHNSTIKGDWLFPNLLGHVYEVYEKTLGIIGLGQIGTRVAVLAHALGMKIQYYDPYRKSVSDLEFPIKFGSLDELLVTSDFVSIHTILNEETRHMISKDKLRMMKSTAYLINTSRGEIVDEDALADFLEEGRIAGAGLDVFGAHTEGPKRGSKILSLPNVVLTPHLAGSTAEAFFRNYYVHSLENIMRTVRKEAPLYIVRQGE
ncbi:MAG: hydroxyacid dehydrogenase [Syntrophaceae bacterium]|nr:hydroxyacid dehydrogenase [Syntrophaceae bacterium]